MSKELAHDKRVQAGLSTTAALAGLSALATKGGAVGARRMLASAPKTAARLRLTPKIAEKADKTSVGLVTVGAGVGGASGLKFASLQRKEAKKEDPVNVGKSDRWKSGDRDSHWRGVNAMKPVNLGTPDPDDWKQMGPKPQRHLKAVPRPVAPPRRKSYGGIDLEDRRQRRMKGEQWAAAGVGGSAAGILGAQQVRNVAGHRLVPKFEANAAKRTADANAAHGVWQKARRDEGKSKSNAAKYPKRQEYHLRQQANHAAVADNARKANEQFTRSAGRWAKGAKMLKPSNKGAVALAGTALAGGAAAYGMKRMRRGQGRHYSDWWDG